MTRAEAEAVLTALKEILVHGHGEVRVKIHEKKITDIEATKKVRLTPQ